MEARKSDPDRGLLSLAARRRAGNFSQQARFDAESIVALADMVERGAAGPELADELVARFSDQEGGVQRLLDAIDYISDVVLKIRTEPAIRFRRRSRNTA